jgi:hypothetical protein
MALDASTLNRIRENDLTLTSLNLEHNYFGRNYIDATDTKNLSEVLMENKTLTSLDLNTNNIGDAGLKDLCKALKENKTLTSLCLNWNVIDTANLKDLTTNYLERNKALAQILDSFKASFAAELGFLIDRDMIEEHLKQLNDLMHISPKTMDNKHHLPNELFRLLTGLEHIANYQSYEQVDSLFDALECLIHAFANTSLHTPAYL